MNSCIINSDVSGRAIGSGMMEDLILYQLHQDGQGDEERNKGNGDGEGDTEDMGEYLGKEEEVNGIDTNLEMTDVPTKEEVKVAVNKLKDN